MDEVTIQYTGDAPVIIGHQYMFPGDVRTVPRFLFAAAAAGVGREKFVVDGEEAPAAGSGADSGDGAGTSENPKSEGQPAPPSAGSGADSQQPAATSARKKAA